MKSKTKALAVKAICFAVLLILYSIEPFWRIRICRIREGRVGHLAMNTDALLRRWQIDGRPPRTTYIFITSGGRAANEYLLKMWKAILPVVREGLIAVTLRKFIQVYPRSRFHYDLTISSTEYREYALAGRRLSLPSTEQDRGATELEKLGIGRDRWIVAFGNRDAAYLAKNFPNLDWSYHSYRDSSVGYYIKAMQDVQIRGGVAVRMGAAVASPLPELGPNIVDYAVRGRTDFLDIYLTQRCRFVVGNANGLMQLPLIFDTPYLTTNLVPLFTMYFGKKVLFMPKLFKPIGSDAFLPFSALQKLGMFDDALQVGLDSDWYTRNGIIPIENDDIDIADACVDMFDLLEGIPPSVEDREI